MAISSPGIGSGIDVNAIVEKLSSIERQPIVRLQTQEARVDAKVSAFGRIKSALSALQDAARALTDASTWKAVRATSADPVAVKATATGAAATGAYGVLVDRLAQRQTTASALMDPNATVFSAGTLTIERGTVSGFASASPPGGSASVTIVAGDTLSAVRDRINAADAGVVASLVNDTGGTRLVLRAADTGEANAFRVVAQDGAAAAGQASLAALAIDPSAPPTGAGTQVKQSAGDARVTIDGLSIDSAGNRLTGVIDGVTLDLQRRGTEPVEVQVATDGEAMSAALKKFTDAYNALNTLLTEQTRYDPASKVAGPLQGDQNATNILARLRSLLGDGVAGAPAGAFARLSDIGVTLQRDGSLATDPTRLQTALATPRKLQDLFAATDADPTRTGIGRRFADLAFSMLGTEGVIATATDSLGRLKRDLDQRQEVLERRVQGVQARLLKQYTELDTKLAQVSSIDWSKLYVDYSRR